MPKVSLNAPSAGAEAVPPPGSVHLAPPASPHDTGVSAAYTPSGMTCAWRMVGVCKPTPRASTRSPRLRPNCAGSENATGLYRCARDVIESQRSHGEWLWDVSWLRYRRRPPRAQALADPELDYLNEAVLIVECGCSIPTAAPSAMSVPTPLFLPTSRASDMPSPPDFDVV